MKTSEAIARIAAPAKPARVEVVRVVAMRPPSKGA
jgi:hypothetical protein